MLDQISNIGHPWTSECTTPFPRIGTVIIAAAIAWGISQHKRRNRANDAITDAATRELYEHPDRYAAKTRDELQDQIKP